MQHQHCRLQRSQQQRNKSTRHEHDHKPQQGWTDDRQWSRQHTFAKFGLPQQLRPMTYPNTNGKSQNSNRRPHWCLWVQVGLHDQQEQPTDRYPCPVSQPILPVTWLTEQGFTIHLSEQPTITHPNGFEAKLRANEGTYFLPVSNTGTPPNYKLHVHDTQQGIKATITPITLTREGAQWVTHQHVIWT